ncbi:MAG: DUF3786 domain-containing protein [Deltaproteobacteria bacterium]|jgi:hypothetical protein|nr:DUF3786 domain-containing protein [Deltaproteobacteria bacterium]
MRTDDYKNAVKLAVAELSRRDGRELAAAGGADYFPEGRMEFKYVHDRCRVELPGWKIGWAPPKEAEEFPLTDQVLVCHYFQGAKNLSLTGDLLSYRQIPGGEFYNDAFHRRAEIPLAQVFGKTPGLLAKASLALGGEIKEGYGDEAALFRVFPHIDILVQIYLADDEFEARGQVLFDRVAGQYLSNEDISWLGSGLVYKLMGAARALGS